MSTNWSINVKENSLSFEELRKVVTKDRDLVYDMISKYNTKYLKNPSYYDNEEIDGFIEISSEDIEYIIKNFSLGELVYEYDSSILKFFNKSKTKFFIYDLIQIDYEITNYWEDNAYSPFLEDTEEDEEDFEEFYEEDDENPISEPFGGGWLN